MNSFTAYIASHVVATRKTLRSELGQGALEYIAIVVGIVIAVAIGFKIAGINIFDEASTFVQDVIGKSNNSGLGS